MLEVLAWFSLGIAFLCFVIIAIHEIRNPQMMAVMNLVWPITALYLSVFGLWIYFRHGVKMAAGEHGKPMPPMAQGGSMRGMAHSSPTATQAMIAATHCAAGCVLGDIVTESVLFASGTTILGSELLASFVWDFVAAWSLGIVFQYFTIKPMRQLSVGQALVAAIKADTLSISAFQVGMYGWMTVVYFRLFPQPHLHPNEAVYWLMMQIAMVWGFFTSMPMNWWLLKIGWKESMG
jgi:hypothetical protein